jgi:hypothetical protein
MMLAPIVLFVYNRPTHTRQTVEALQKNTLAKDSDLIIYSDAPKTPEAATAVNEVRDYIRTISGFKSVSIIERDRNWGLANSIIDGVTSVVNKYGRIIVLEDDIVASCYFLDYINRALDYYSSEPRVWHISGWNFPINPIGISEAFFSRAMYCWGWATWADRWKNYQKDPDQLMAEWDAAKINRFNLDGKRDFWNQVKQNATGKLNTWAVFWYATIFEHNALCLNPAISYVENIGLDKSGEHGEETAIYSSRLNSSRLVGFPDGVSESSDALTRTQQFCAGAVVARPSLLRSMAALIKKLLW